MLFKTFCGLISLIFFTCNAYAGKKELADKYTEIIYTHGEAQFIETLKNLLTPTLGEVVANEKKSMIDKLTEVGCSQSGSLKIANKLNGLLPIMLQIAEKSAAKIAPAMLKKAKTLVSSFYAQHFTDDELKQLIEFAKLPVAEKSRTLAADLSKIQLQVGVEFASGPMREEMEKEIQESYKNGALKTFMNEIQEEAKKEAAKEMARKEVH